MVIKFIAQNKNGDYYVVYELTANRSINPASWSKQNEVLIIGIPKNKWAQFCKTHNIKEDHYEI